MYVCQNHEELTTNCTLYEKQRRMPGALPYRFKRYTICFRACNGYPFRDQCLSEGRQQHCHSWYIEPSEFEGWLTGNEIRVAGKRELYRKRQSKVEHPYGTIKRASGYTYTLSRTKEKVTGEFSLIFTAYNLRRGMSMYWDILGIDYLTDRLKGMKAA